MRKYTVWISLFSILMIFSSCSNDVNETTENKEPASNYSEEEKESSSVEDDAKNWISTGIHHEKIDSDTVEIETTESKELYLLSESAREDLKNIKSDAEISFLYQHHEDKEYPVIHSIKDVNYDWDSHHDQKHHFDDHYHHHSDEHPNKDHYEKRNHKPHHENQSKNHHNEDHHNN